MQTRTITVDYARPRGYDVGYRAENNFTLLALPIPAELEGADSYRVYFESTVGEALQTELLTPTDGYVTVKITSDIVPEPGQMAAQLVAFADGEIVGYAPMITGSAKVSIPDGTERLSHSLAAEIALNTAARHSHENKSVLDKFAESKDGKPTYDGEPIGGENTIYIPATLNFSGGLFTIETSATFEQIDTAYKSGQEQILKVFLDDSGADSYLMSITTASPGNFYYFGTFYGEHSMLAVVMPPDEWSFVMYKLIDHTHDNKPVLDKLSVTGGKLQYNGSDVGLKPSQVTSGTSITLADNTEYRLADVTTLTLTYPTGNFECWMRLTFAASGNVTVTLPAGTKYIGTAPDFKNGETWEMSIKDGVVIAQKVGDGT